MPKKGRLREKSSTNYPNIKRPNNALVDQLVADPVTSAWKASKFVVLSKVTGDYEPSNNFISFWRIYGSLV